MRVKRTLKYGVESFFYTTKNVSIERRLLQEEKKRIKFPYKDKFLFRKGGNQCLERVSVSSEL